MKRVLVTAMLLAVSVLPARADILYDTIYDSLTGKTVDTTDALEGTQWTAIRFKSPGSYVPQKITLSMDGGNTLASAWLIRDTAGTLDWVPVTGSPNLISQAIGIDAIGGSDGNYTELSSSLWPLNGSSLASGQYYWLAVQMSPWMAGPVTGDWGTYNSATASYNYWDTGTSTWKTATGYAPMVRIEGTRTPEPGTLALVGAGLALLARKRKRSRSVRSQRRAEAAVS